MAGRVTQYLRNNILGLLALTISIGMGTAWAADKLAKNSVGTKQLKNDAVVSEKVEDGSLLGADFKAGQLPTGPAGSQGVQGPQGEPGPAGSPDTAEQVLDKIKQVDGPGSGLDADTVAGMASTLIGTKGFSDEGSCSDDNHAAPEGEVCTTVNLTLPRAGRVLLMASGIGTTESLDDTTGLGSATDDTTLVHGKCRVTADGVTETTPTEMKDFHLGGATPFSIVTIANSLGSGPRTFQVKCQEVDGDIDFNTLSLAAVMIGLN